MKTLTIRLPDEMARQIEQDAALRHVSKSDVVREKLSNSQAPVTADVHMRNILEECWASADALPAPHRRLSQHKQRIVEAIRAKKLRR